MSRSGRIKGSQGRLLPVISPLGLFDARKAKAVMCEIIQFRSRARVETTSQNLPPDMIDVYEAKNGKTGIDACVSAALAAEMHVTEFLPGMMSCVRGNNGMVGFDAQVSAPVAERMLMAARRAGVSVRR
jgi:hypothetical protein